MDMDMEQANSVQGNVDVDDDGITNPKSKFPTMSQREQTVRQLLSPSKPIKDQGQVKSSTSSGIITTLINSVSSLQGKARIPMYSPPLQRQRWDEAASLPHVDWGDMFLDLFYVAAAYNLGGVFINAINKVGNPESARRGILFFVTALLALWQTWFNKYSYDSKYVVVDYTHRFINIVRILAIALAILHVKDYHSPVESDDDSNVDTLEIMLFIVGIFIESLVQLILQIEAWCVGRGGPEMNREAKMNVLLFSLPLSMVYLAATVVSVLHYNSSSLISSRVLAVWLVLSGYLYYQVMTLVYSFYVYKMNTVKEVTTPINIDFTHHRFGEWVMLLLGEAVLSLLIVSISLESEYYFVVFIGIVTTVMIHDLHFESQPSHSDPHAMMSVTRGACYVIGIQIYSIALITLGASYKYMLDIFNWELSGQEHHDYGESTDCTGNRLLRFLSGASVEGCPDQALSDEAVEDCPGNRLLRFLNADTTGASAGCEEESGAAHHVMRLLSGSIVDPHQLEVSENALKKMYGISLIIVLVFIECNCVLHKGFPTQLNRMNKWSLLIGLVKGCLLIAVAVLTSPATTNISPHNFAIVGACVVFIFVVLRIIKDEVIGEEQEHHDVKNDSEREQNDVGEVEEGVAVQNN